MSDRHIPEQQRLRSYEFPRNFLAAVNSTPLDGDLFLQLVDIANEALGGRRLVLPPVAERCLEGFSGYAFTAVPENQMAFAIFGECRRRFRKRGEAIAQSFLFRWFAILVAKEEGSLDEFIRSKAEGEIEVNEAVFRAAAVCPLNKDGRFDTADYVARIQALARDDAQSPDQ
jgi:hypothetical protein